MSQPEIRYPFETAIEIAASVLAELAPVVFIAEIAGSLRRRRKEVGDIEILCQPDYSKKVSKQVDMFDSAMVPEFIEVVSKIGKLKSEVSEKSRSIKIDHPSGIRIDIYIPQPQDYYRMLVIRTGNWIFTRDVIATGWVKRGWVGTPDGLRRRDECIQQGPTKWKVNPNIPQLTMPPAWKSEQEFFDFINIKYVLPEYREMSDKNKP